jgi:hypothetical protein
MQLEHPKEQRSSLGISKVLEQEARLFEERNKRDSFTDATFKKVPSQGASLWTWTRFVVSLYYNKVHTSYPLPLSFYIKKVINKRIILFFFVFSTS